MRIEIVGEGANARHRHPIGACDLTRGEGLTVGQDEVAIALHFTPARAIQVKKGETRIALSVEEVFALFHAVTVELGLDQAEVADRLEALAEQRDALQPAE